LEEAKSKIALEKKNQKKSEVYFLHATGTLAG
jgi:hypothetical protein